MRKSIPQLFRKSVMLGILVVMALCSKASFAQPFAEPFNYTPDATNGLSAQSAGLWVRINTGDSILVTSGNLSYPGLTTSSGNMISYAGAGADYYRPFTNQTTGTVYASFLLNVSSITGITTTGGYTFGYMENNSTSNFGATVWIRNNANAGTTQYNIGVNPRTTAANTAWATNVLELNTTYLVVISYQIVAGATNDIVKMWVNPTSFGGTEPTADASGTNTGTDLTTGVQRFFCRQDAAGTTPALSMDELRVATSWAEVTPSVISGNTTLPAGTYNNFTMNGGAVTLTGNCTMAGTLTLTSGNITLGANGLTATTIAGGSASSYIVTDGAGMLTINSVGSTNVLFPVGRTSYNPATLNNSGTVDNFSVSVQNSLDNPSMDDNHAVHRQWNISEAVAGGSNLAITLQWATAQEGTDMGHLVTNIGHWNGTGYDLTGGTLAGADPAWTVTSTGFTTFSPFIVGDDFGLPVELSSFTSTVNSNNVKLNWSTVSEENNSGFDVERKVSGRDSWAKITNVAGNGTSNNVHTYSFEDRNLASGKYSYRLKQIDYNGNFTYYDLSNEVIIGAPGKYSLTQNFPNPFNPSTTISYEIPVNNFVSLKIYDMMGKEVASLVNGNQEAGFYSVKFDASKLASGIYFYKLQANDFSSTKKLMLVK